MNKILSIVFIYFFSFGVFGADAISKYGGYTPEQIIALPENIRRSEVPMTFVFAAQTGQNDLLMSMYLNSLMNSGLSDYRLAVKDFQKDFQRDEQEDSQSYSSFMFIVLFPTRRCGVVRF